VHRWHAELPLMLRRANDRRADTFDADRSNYPAAAPRRNAPVDLGAFRKSRPHGCLNRHCTRCHWSKNHEPARRRATIRAEIRHELSATGIDG
jgi:hypothetical protein